MRIRILGSAAGGGFPQWNCHCRLCHGVRANTITATPRTQSSIAISSNGEDWILCNASPDILQQIAAFPPLRPGRQVRDSSIAAIILTDSQIDHTAGLLMLREGGPLPVYCTQAVQTDLSSRFPIFTLLNSYTGVKPHIIIPQHTFTIPHFLDLRFTPLELASKAPPYSIYREKRIGGENIGLLITDQQTGKKIFYAPGLGVMTEALLDHLQQADCLLIDGTFWHADDMVQAGVGKKHAQEMGHIPLAGDDGLLNIITPLTKPRKILIHINNTNPILDEKSPERALLNNTNIEVAHDGMEISF
jgi:pyrroloquinoline quinone biosynthesis protein B